MLKHISILLPEGQAIVDTIVGTRSLFQMATAHSRKNGHPSAVQTAVDLVALDDRPRVYQGVLSITPTATLKDIASTDLVVVPGIVGDMVDHVARNQPYIDWMMQQRIQNRSEMASLCRGAFLLAATGLLEGKTCATHWITHDTFRSMYPSVDLAPNKVIAEEDGIYSSGGAYSYLSLVLYLIERHFGRETAIWCSKVAEIDFDRMDQNQFTIFNGQKDHSDEEVLAAQTSIEAHYADALRVDDLAKTAAISTRNFIRRFKKATNNTPTAYIQRVRMEAAKKQLESSIRNVTQVMLKVGYTDAKTFRTLFKRYVGMTPLEYRKKYNRELALV